jgi:hypothetical protein
LEPPAWAALAKPGAAAHLGNVFGGEWPVQRRGQLALARLSAIKGRQPNDKHFDISVDIDDHGRR